MEVLQKERAELAKIADKANKTLEVLKAKEPEMVSSIKVCREKLDEAKSSLQNVATRSKVLSGLLKQRDSGRIRGIFVSFFLIFFFFFFLFLSCLLLFVFFFL